MILILGYIVVIASTLGGFMLAGGHPMVLMHLSEFVIIGGIALGVLLVASPNVVIKQIISSVINAFQSQGLKREEMIELFKLLYEMFMAGRRNGLIALDDHVSDPQNSSIFQKYPSFSKDPKRVAFMVNALRPVIDGKIKPDGLEPLLHAEIETMEDEGHRPLAILTLVGDSLPGIGIIAAVLGIINTMAAISDGPEKVGAKVAAALTGTFLGILGAYGFINPIHKRIEFTNDSNMLYFQAMSRCISGFAKGLSPIMAIEIARRGLPNELQIPADDLEKMLKDATNG